MKNILKLALSVALLTGVSLASTSWAGVTIGDSNTGITIEKPKVEILDASKIQIVNFYVELTKNGKSVNSFNSAALVGQSVQNSNVIETGYIKSAVKKDDQITISAGVVTAGFEVELTPQVDRDGKVLLYFNAKQTTLNSLEDVKQDDGMWIQKPNTTTHAITQAVYIKKGEPYTVKFMDREGSSENYVMTIKAS